MEQAPPPLLPWEDAAAPDDALAKLLATARLLLTDPEAAGAALGAHTTLGRAIGFFALAGLPCQWVASFLAQFANLHHPERQAALMRMLHLPEPGTPSAQALAFQKVMVLAQTALFPFFMALGVLILGLLIHGGLWGTRALRHKRGLEVTYRTLLYAAGATSWIGLLNSFGAFLPGAAFLVHQAFSVALGLGIFTYQGLLLAKAHGVETWRGVVGIFLPVLLFCLCCACCLGAFGASLAAAAR